MPARSVLAQRIVLALLTVLLSIGAVPFFSAKLHAAPYVTNRTLTLSDSRSLHSPTNYNLAFSFPASTVVGTIVLEVCDESPLPNTTCTTPSGFSSTSATFVTQTGELGFTYNNALSSGNKMVITRAPSATTATNVSYLFGNITNPDDVRTYYARIYVYPTNNATGPASYEGGIAFAINRYVPVQAEVPPYLLFCVAQTIPQYNCTSAAGQFIDFGELSTTQTKAAQHQLLVATNAPYGLGITMTGQTLTSGNNIIPSLVSPTSPTTGQSQFGVNFRANSSPNIGLDPVGPGTGVTVSPNYNIANRFTFNNGDVVASSSGTTDLYRITGSMMVNIAKSQKPGVYNTTILYICLANF